MLRGALFIGFAIIIDLLQMIISAALFAVGAAPGTTVGAAGGCAFGAWIAGKYGCLVGGFLGGVAASAANVVAPTLLPFMIGLGIGINFCLDVTLGAILTIGLASQNMWYPKYALSGWVAELMPGVNNVPAWTISTALAVFNKSAEDGMLKGTSLGTFAKLATAGSFAGAAISENASVGEKIMHIADHNRDFREERGEQAARRVVGSDLRNIRTAPLPSQTHAA